MYQEDLAVGTLAAQIFLPIILCLRFILLPFSELMLMFEYNCTLLFFQLIRLIPLCVLDVGEATTSALPPTLSLHYAFPYHHSLPFGFTSHFLLFMTLFITQLKFLTVCLTLDELSAFTPNGLSFSPCHLTKL
ncbi:hypothetical protein XENOCAPTIV_030412 [Xenoophorus captivus]|uniref:Uncharacterized protein n=1 Tax=Xenoophorus captivus TaxID=1517983 RepID=A0ABV0RAQ6_9TELE